MAGTPRGLDLGDGIRTGSGDGHGSGAPGKAHLMNEWFHDRVYAGGIIGFLEFISRMLSTEMDDLKRLELFGVAPDETASADSGWMRWKLR